MLILGESTKNFNHAYFFQISLSSLAGKGGDEQSSKTALFRKIRQIAHIECSQMMRLLWLIFIEITISTNSSESLAWQALYNATDGQNWYRCSDIDSTPCDCPLVICDGNGSVVKIDLQANTLQGSLPDQIGDFASLTHLDVSFNHLSGEFPASLFALSALSYLDVSSNLMNGSIPPLQNTSMLEVLVLANNHFTGCFPGPLSALSSLSMFRIDRNSFATFLHPETVKFILKQNSLRLAYLISNAAPSNQIWCPVPNYTEMVGNGILAGGCVPLVYRDNPVTYTLTGSSFIFFPSFPVTLFFLFSFSFPLFPFPPFHLMFDKKKYHKRNDITTEGAEHPDPIKPNVPNFVTNGCGLTFEVTPKLPPGLQLNPTTGIISGTTQQPLEATTYVIRASDGQSSTSVQVSITIIGSVLNSARYDVLLVSLFRFPLVFSFFPLSSSFFSSFSSPLHPFFPLSMFVRACAIRPRIVEAIKSICCSIC